MQGDRNDLQKCTAIILVAVGYLDKMQDVEKHHAVFVDKKLARRYNGTVSKDVPHKE